MPSYFRHVPASPEAAAAGRTGRAFPGIASPAGRHEGGGAAAYWTEMTTMNRADDLIAVLRAAASPERCSGMSRFGIPTERALGIAVPALRKIARETGTDHPLAVALWDTGWHEARLLAPMIADPRQTTVELADRWTQQFDAWDVCDLCCQNLLRRTAFAYELVERYAPREEEYVRRTAFALTAALAIGDKRSPDERFLPLLGLIGKAADDPRNFVKKAVNWALRQTGKRSLRLHGEAVELSRTLASSQDRTARWIGRDSLRELTDPKVIARIGKLR